MQCNGKPKDMTALSIIIPCYNESQSLEDLFKKCRTALAGRDDVEFIFVNNGSTDNSSAVFEQLIRQPGYSFAKIINIEINRGYGSGILSGLKTAKGEVLGWTHADLQTDPVDAIRAYEKFKQLLHSERVIVKGNRTGRPLFDVMFTAGMSLLSSVLLLTPLKDVNAQPKIFHKSFMAHMAKAPLDFSLDLYVLYIAMKNSYGILTYDVSFEKRAFGEAKGGGSLKGKIKLARRTFSYILKLRKEIQKL